MKLDIKSFLIGLLTTVNLFLLMGFDDHEDEVQKNGRYQVIIDNEGQKNWYDTRYGDKVAMELGSYGYILLKEKGGAKATFKKEFEFAPPKKQGFSGYMNELYNHINNTNIANDPKDISLWKDACYQIMESV